MNGPGGLGLPRRGNRLLDSRHEVPHTPSLNERVQELRYRAHKYLLTNSHFTAYIHGM